MDYLTLRYLSHSGVKGQKWGVRRYQNADGSLTPEGRIHYGLGNLDYNARYSGDKKSAKAAFKAERKQLYDKYRKVVGEDDSETNYMLIERDYDIWDKKHKQYKKKLKGYLDVDNQDYDSHYDGIERYNKDHPDDKIDPHDDATWEEKNPDTWDEEYWDEQEGINEANHKAAAKYIDDYLASKYGQQYVTKANAASRAKGAVATGAALTVLAAITIGTIYGGVKLSEKAADGLANGLSKGAEKIGDAIERSKQKKAAKQSNVDLNDAINKALKNEATKRGMSDDEFDRVIKNQRR